jgi:hypothetical protein
MASNQAGVLNCIMVNKSIEVYEGTKWLSAAKVYYWKEFQEPAMRGPFNSIIEATMHYDIFVKVRASQPDSNVLFVNFNTKRRIG